MANTNVHIISKFSWQTLFDNKDKGFELQERLSNWCRIYMPGIVSDIFDDMCPKEQVWHMSLLELNLGVIEYENFESGIKLQLYNQLKEQLSNLILYPGNNKVTLQVMHGDKSFLLLIENFLVHGFMPWTYRESGGTVNNLLAEQLLNNSSELRELIIKLGITSKNVRKRIAWQVSDENIIRIIKLLEPNHHGQILEFSAEVVKIQEKETIVQAGTRDFKKQLWLWVLNYILTERGTVFNRITFARSSLMQMAVHYNISYKALLDVISRAVTVVRRHSTINSSFLNMLQTLINEQEGTALPQTLKSLKGDNSWLTLEKLLYNTSIATATQKQQLNELITKLERKDSKRLKNILSGALKNNAQNAIYRLTTNNIKLVIALLDKQHYNAYLTSAATLKSICEEAGFKISLKEILSGGFTATYITGNIFTHKKFTDTLIHKVALKYKLDKQACIIRLFISSQTDNNLKNNDALSTYRHLKNIAASSLSGTTAPSGTAITLNQLEELLQTLELINYGNYGLAGKEKFIKLNQYFLQSARIQPHITLDVLRLYANKSKEFFTSLNYLFNEAELLSLIKQVNRSAAAIITNFKSCAGKASQLHSAFKSFLQEETAYIGLQIIIADKNYEGQNFIIKLLQHIRQSIPQSQLHSFMSYVDILLAENIIQAEILQKLKLYNIIANKQNAVTQSFNQQLKTLINSNAPKANICLLLSSYSIDDIVTLKKQDNALYSKILSYLINNGVQFEDSVITEYLRLLIQIPQNKKRKITYNTLEILFWQNLLNYKAHNFEVKRFSEQFAASVRFLYPKGYNITLPGHLSGYVYAETDGPVIYLNNNQVLNVVEATTLLKKAIADNKTKVISANGKEISLYTLFELVLEQSPKHAREVILSVTAEDKKILLIKKSVGFSRFSLWIFNDTPGTGQEAMQSLQQLYAVFTSVATGNTLLKVEAVLWSALFTFINPGAQPFKQLNNVVEILVQILKQGSQYLSAKIIAQLQKIPVLNIQLKHILQKHITSTAEVDIIRVINKPELLLLKAKRKGVLQQLAVHLISYRQLPSWFGHTEEKDSKVLLNELVKQAPVSFYMVLKHHVVTENRLQWLHNTISFKTLIVAVASVNMYRHATLKLIEQLYYGIGSMGLSSVSPAYVQQIIFSKLIKAWTTNNWEILSVNTIWNEILWECSIKKNISAVDVIRQIKLNKALVPPALLISLQKAEEDYITGAKPFKSKRMSPTTKPEIETVQSKKNNEMAEMIPVKNAGVVLLNNYIPTLFNRLSLLNNKQFIDAEKQNAAVHYLQFLITGLTHTEEHLLPLNKVLCGILLQEAVTEGIEITEDEKKLIEGLLKAAIGYWPVIGESSLNGFRGNWLVRDGLLTETQERWELKVEKRAYDLLINQSPFSFSIIKYGWMDKPLHVTWIT